MDIFESFNWCPRGPSGELTFPGRPEQDNGSLGEPVADGSESYRELD